MRRIAMALIGVLVAVGAGALSGTIATATAAAPDPVAALRDRVEGWLGTGTFARARFGVLAVSLDTGDTLLAHDPDASLAPASNLKLVTTAAALHHLGPDFRWVTLLVSTAPEIDGVLEGDLVLYGTGDPGLAARLHGRDAAPFDSLASHLRARGITRVRGRLLGDGTFFSGPDRVADWDPADLNDWFASAAPALSYAENVVQFRIATAAVGEAPIVHFEPDHGGVPVTNEARTVAGRPRTRLIIDRATPLEPALVTGEIALGSRDVYRSMTVPDPVLFAAHGMLAALERAGITVDGGAGTVTDPSHSPLSATTLLATPGAATQAPTPRTPTPRTLATFRSPPLIDALQVVNRRSHNLYADLVLRTLGRVVGGDGSFASGARVVERYAVEQAGVTPGELTIIDGSGLAATNRASAGAFVTILRHIDASPAAEAFRATLPEAGSRELNNRMRRTAAAGNLVAKTGTIEGVSALSGIVRTADGERIAFSVLGNDLRSPYAAKRSVEDALGVALAELAGRPLAPATSPPALPRPQAPASNRRPRSRGRVRESRGPVPPSRADG